MKTRFGFTLVEMVIVLLLLGILGVFAIPRFVNIVPEAQQGAVNSVAAALGAAVATNYATRKSNATQGVAVTNCQNGALTLPGGALPPLFSIDYLAIAADAQVTCTVRRTPGGTATFIGLGVP